MILWPSKYNHDFVRLLAFTSYLSCHCFLAGSREQLCHSGKHWQTAVQLLLDGCCLSVLLTLSYVKEKRAIILHENITWVNPYSLVLTYPFVKIGALLEEETTVTWTVCKFDVLQLYGGLAVMRPITWWCLWKRCNYPIFVIFWTNNGFANIIRLSHIFDNKWNLQSGLSCGWLFGLRECAIFFN